MPTLSVKGQYFLTLDNIEFDSTQLHSIQLFEYAGLVLPQATITFETADPEQRARLYTGKEVTIAISETQEDSNIPLKFKVVNTISTPNGSGLYIIKVTLEQSLPAYSDMAVSASYKGTSLSTIEALCKKFTDVDNQAKGANDSQVWLQPLTVARDFLQSIWMRSRLSNSTLLASFTLDGVFRMRDTLSIRSRGIDYDYRVLSEIKDKIKDIAILGSLDEVSASGVLAYIAASGRVMQAYRPATGTHTAYTTNKNLDFLSDRPVLEIGTPNLNILPTLFTDNTHNATPQALLDNKANMARLSTVSVSTQTTGRYIAIHPLDLVMVLEPHSSATSMVEAGSGLYIATTVVREIRKDKKLTTTVVLSRESRNGGV